MVLCSHLLKNFPWFFVIHTVKGFSVVSEADSLVISFLFCDPTNVGNSVSGSSAFYPIHVLVRPNPAWLPRSDKIERVQGGITIDSSAFSKSSLYMWKFSVHILLKLSLKDFEHDLASM